MRRALLGVVLLLALTGCGGGDPKVDPSPSPSPSAPVSTPVSTTPSAPVMPEEAKAGTSAGAIAFVKFYVQAINHGTTTGDVRSLRDTSRPNCSSCKEVIDKVVTLYAAGGHSEGGTWRLVGTRITSVRTPWMVAAHITYSDQTIVHADGTQEKFAAGDYDMSFTLTYRNGQWQVCKWVRH